MQPLDQEKDVARDGVNLYAGYNWFEFRVFFFIDWLLYQGKEYYLPNAY